MISRRKYSLCLFSISIHIYFEIYYRQHIKQIKKNRKKYCKNNKEIISERTIEYYQKNREHITELHRQYLKTPSGKIANRKSKYKHNRNLGYNILNPQDSSNIEYEGHHINLNDVLFIPKNLHKSVSHSVLMDRNMNKINLIAIEWYYKHINGFI